MTLICQICEYEFPLPAAKKKERRDWLITLAICPACGSEQNPEQCRRFDGQKRCRTCHLPESLLPVLKIRMNGHTYYQIFRKKLCTPCYLAERKGILVSMKPRSVTIRKTRSEITPNVNLLRMPPA